MTRFFVAQECIQGGIAVISGNQAHHILNVLRLRKGAKLQLFDGSSRLYQGEILDTQAKQVKVKIECVRKVTPLAKSELTLVQALPKKHKMDYIVEKATELGVDAIIPVETARTVVRLKGARQLSRKLRWQKIAQEAARQCSRTTIPQVRDLSAWPDIVSCLDKFDLKLLFCLGKKTRPIKDILRSRSRLEKIILFIGPEGDFTPAEVNQAQQAGCIPASLGKTVLKSDTAAVCALAVINYELRQ